MFAALSPAPVAAQGAAAAVDSTAVLRLGVAWQGESHMQDRLSAGLAEILELVAPRIEVEWRRELPSMMALDQTAREFQGTKDAMVLLRSTGATWLGQNPPSIPSFIGGCNDPVILGAVPDLEAPGGMITGVTYTLAHHDVLKAFKAILPGLESILLIYQIDHPGGTIDRVGVRAACAEFEIEYYEEGCRTHIGRQGIIRNWAGEVSAILLINNSVVADFPAMHARFVDVAGSEPLLHWLADGNFVFLGAATYRRGGRGSCSAPGRSAGRGSAPGPRPAAPPPAAGRRRPRCGWRGGRPPPRPGCRERRGSSSAPRA